MDFLVYLSFITNSVAIFFSEFIAFAFNMHFIIALGFKFYHKIGHLFFVSNFTSYVHIVVSVGFIKSAINTIITNTYVYKIIRSEVTIT